MLSTSQQSAFDSYIKGSNLFISGYAGTGKSYLINTIYEHAKQHNKDIQVTAMTGCAAVLLKNAKTLHSWAGIGLGTSPINKLIENIRRYKHIDNWTNIDILVIDEISMMSKQLFELINLIAQKIRKSSRLFGGIQLICCGDFHQLPPIENEFCFESEIWDKTFTYQYVLKENFRQKDDLEFQTLLNEIREGCITPESCKILLECSKKHSTSDIKPTLLYPTKKYADQINQFENLTLDTPAHTYKKFYSNEPYSHILEELERQKGMFEDTLILKVGSQVMCIANLSQEEGIVNGSQGIVIDFMGDFPVVKFKNVTKIIEVHKWKNEKYENYGICQIPLILSWAITIHKAQGITLDEICINIGSTVFEYGQTYVALSRVTSLDGLYIKSLDIGKIRANPKVIEFYKRL